MSRSSFFAKRSSTVETEDTLLLDDDTSLETEPFLQSKSLANLHYMTDRLNNKLGNFCELILINFNSYYKLWGMS